MVSTAQKYAPEPPADCKLCPRLVDFRDASAQANPDWFNGAVPSFGDADAKLLIIGLAPGLRGANRTGRPFTGDYAGDLLYATLIKFGFADGVYDARPDDGLTLRATMITNAVRCVPPQNKPTTQEIKTCRGFLNSRIAAMTGLRAILALGRVAHETTLSTLDLRRPAHPFSHGGVHEIGADLRLFDSYHCSRYNTNTRRLTPEMFEAVFTAITDHLRG